MVTRQEQFEMDRQKMLASIGKEPDEPKIEIKKKEKESVSNAHFNQKLQDLKYDNPNAEEYESRALRAFEEECDFNSAVSGMSEKERKRAEKLRQNKQKRTKERYHQNKYLVDGFGFVIDMLDNFQATNGGGFIFQFYLYLILLPVAAYWYLTENWMCGIIAAVFMFFVGRVASLWLSLLALGVMNIVRAIGPRYICDIREGSPAVKLIVSLLNKGLWVATYGHIFLFVGLFTFLAMDSNWTKYNWINHYCLFFGVSLVTGGIFWFANALIGFAIYDAIISAFLSGSAPIKYRLRYLHNKDRVMIPTRKCDGPFVSKQERLKAFSQAYTGIA